MNAGSTRIEPKERTSVYLFIALMAIIMINLIVKVRLSDGPQVSAENLTFRITQAETISSPALPAPVPVPAPISAQSQPQATPAQPNAVQPGLVLQPVPTPSAGQ